MRDENGRFIAGNPGSPGRPKRQTEVDYLSIMEECLTVAKWRQIVNAAIELAIKGDARSRRWISDYCLGRPAQIIELRGAEQMQLSQLIDFCKTESIAPSDLFAAMIEELAALKGVQTNEPE